MMVKKRILAGAAVLFLVVISIVYLSGNREEKVPGKAVGTPVFLEFMTPT